MRFFDKMKAGMRVYGTCITSFNPLWPRIWEAVGLDFVFLDTEHIALDRTQVAHLCRQLRASGVVPIVRVAAPSAVLAGQMIDAGAGGVVVPYVESVEEVRQLVGATKYRPIKGQKLARLLRGEESLTPELQAYLQEYNGPRMAIVNIESVPALEELEGLLSVPGLDAVFIGPHDLSVSMGLPEQYDHPEVEQAMRRIVQVARAKGLHVGVHFSASPKLQVQWIAEGVDMILHSSDYALFFQRLQEDITYIRSQNGDGEANAARPETI
ncbi:2,4-dihydroxyhept-2-ene-1,7-dioic acid aldolase [Lunatimonas lonarensis]|uniref:2,4-dihydroxyhept-2-ene-1,7-dioic acid aldolase n=1 Tax=Lunatimonas lonarensis TaxID=1232681 RepID=R7ZWF8_9BACT|nr:aldolase/citrate lyase family protein [Lunatimonas lonarensis]EON78480.1 2,4-dihydroxyhept-2-ene-1,7-dioic acid aldolase [Lunatimonas lonarensis]